MPAEWDEDAPAEIDDPAAVIPEDWDEEEDGEFEAPKIPNPACKTGCGKWSAPQIKNPDYKGKWFPPMIDNPEYKGEWAPKRIANPGYWDAETHADALATPLSKIGGVVVEVWTMQGNMLFDNVWVGNSIDSARAFADSTFKLKAEAEEAFKKTKLANDKKKAREAILAEGGIVNQARFAIAFVSDWVEENPIGGVAGVLGAITLFFGIVYVTMLGGGGKKKKAADAKGRAKKDDDAASNGNGVHEEDDDEEEENEEGDDDQEEEDDDEEEKEKPKARRRKTRRAD